ncbi:hypothetical protein ACSTS3_15945 [Aquimarina muelleri]|uniref:hypothetical protein n=1 Tax=Aquimarina muelleri TaxID=279356 RepID=UPI003F683232
MPKKPFSILIDDGNHSEIPVSSPQRDKRPHFSLSTEKMEKPSEKIPFSRKLQYWLIENKTRFLHRTYGIYINYNDQKTIQYLFEVKCTGYKKGLRYYTLSRKRFFKDGKQLEGFMEQLAEQSANCLYPLQVSVNKHGQIISVDNQEAIKERWETKQKELAKRYIGVPFINHCKNITNAIHSPKNLLKSLHNDVVYDILFSKLYINYTNKFTQPLEKQFKWFSGIHKLHFYGNQTVSPIIKENNRIVIHYQGGMQSASGLDQGETAIGYELDAKDHTLLRVDGTVKYTQHNTDKTIQFKAIWQKDMDQTEQRKIEDEKKNGIYIDPNVEKKWYEFWK